MELINKHRAIVALRDDKMYITDLLKLAIMRTIDMTWGRIVKSIDRSLEIVAVVGKQKLGIMKKEEIVHVERV